MQTPFSQKRAARPERATFRYECAARYRDGGRAVVKLVGQMRAASALGPVLTNPIIYAELAPAFRTRAELEAWLDAAVFKRLPLPYAAGWRTVQAFRTYRRAGGTRSSPLPDFYIGAHAEAEGLTLVTRDVARYRTYFPTVSIIVP